MNLTEAIGVIVAVTAFLAGVLALIGMVLP